MNGTLAFYLLLSIAVGALGAVHVPINGALGARIQSTVAATLVFYGVAFTVTALLALFAADRSALRALPHVPSWYLVLPGLISVAVVGGHVPDPALRCDQRLRHRRLRPDDGTGADLALRMVRVAGRPDQLPEARRRRNGGPGIRLRRPFLT